MMQSFPVDPVALMRRETTPREGAVPEGLGGKPAAPGHHLLHGDEFLLRHDHFAFHYRKGAGVTVARNGTVQPDDEELFRNGNLYAAVACLNGFMPIHASAVAVAGRVIAFTGPAGAGKSTLVAGLTGLGLPLFCDDTLVLDLSGGGAPLALPGHRRLKLWPEAAAMAGASPLALVSTDYRKVYVTPGGGDVAEVLPLGMLVFLEEGAECALPPLSGGEKIAWLDDDHYTRDLFDQVSRHCPAERFALHARIAGEVAMARFVRPLDPAGFGETTRYLAERLSDMAKP